jgi:hypothetical protein
MLNLWLPSLPEKMEPTTEFFFSFSHVASQFKRQTENELLSDTSVIRYIGAIIPQ